MDKLEDFEGWFAEWSMQTNRLDIVSVAKQAFLAGQEAEKRKVGTFNRVILEWADDQGFLDWVWSHSSVINNLCKWVDLKFGRL